MAGGAAAEWGPQREYPSLRMSIPTNPGRPRPQNRSTPKPHDTLRLTIRSLFFGTLLGATGCADAATLYRWQDASGVVRYGYQPPAGVEAEPAEAERRAIYDRPEPIRCEQLQRDHLALIDRELARIREMRAGLGPEYAISPPLQQQLILDLLAHRAALISGRPASEFRSPSADELLRSRRQLQADNDRMRAEMETQDATIDRQQAQLNRLRGTPSALPGYPLPWYGPGFPMGPGFYWYFNDVPPRR